MMILEEVCDYVKCVVIFKNEYGWLFLLIVVDLWEKKMVEGIVYLVRMKVEIVCG